MNLHSCRRPIVRVAWLALALCVHTFADTNSTPIRIGLLLPPVEVDAKSLRQGAEIAVAWANHHSPGSAQLIVRGRPGQWGDDGVEAGRLVLDDKVSGVIAPPGGEGTHLALQIAGRTATPVVSLCPDNSVTGAGVPWAVRIVPGTVDEARVILRHFATTHSRWAALVPDNRAGRVVAGDLRDAAATTGCQIDPITLDLAHGLPTSDPWLPMPWPDGVLLWLDPCSAGLAAGHLRAKGFQGTLAGPSRLRSVRFSEAAGTARNGVIVVGHKPDPASVLQAERFESDFFQATGRAPDSAAAMACDAATLLLHLSAQSGTESIHRLFPITGTLAGVTGIMQFDQQGNRAQKLELGQFHQGRWSWTLSNAMVTE